MPLPASPQPLPPVSVLPGGLHQPEPTQSVGGQSAVGNDPQEIREGKVLTCITVDRGVVDMRERVSVHARVKGGQPAA